MPGEIDMRAFPLLALLLPGVAVAQTSQGTAAHDNSARLASDFTPAPVPSVLPPRSPDGVPATVAEQMAPPGMGNNIAGPANATPFSSMPSANLPPDAAMPNDRTATQGGDGALVPNTSR